MDIRRTVRNKILARFAAISVICSLTIVGCSSDGLPDNPNQVSGNAQSDDSLGGEAESQNGRSDAESQSASEVQGQAVSNPVTESPVPGGALAITDLVLVTGQSNALGAETSYDPARDVPHPRAFAYTDKGWQVADLNQVWDLGWFPRNHPTEDPYNNFGFHFARTVAARRPDRVIGFVLVTAPGEGIAHWDYESSFYVKTRERVVAALNDLPSKSAIDGILWHQGETDWEETDYYRAKLSDLIRNFRGESWFSSDRPFICGETARAPVNNILMALNNDGDNWTGCVEGDDLPTFLDDYHFSAEGLRIIGTRYATKYIQMSE